jgi:hypothetical protein
MLRDWLPFVYGCATAVVGMVLIQKLPILVSARKRTAVPVASTPSESVAPAAAATPHDTPADSAAEAQRSRDLAASGDHSADFKMVLLVRTDLSMTKGKIAAQVICFCSISDLVCLSFFNLVCVVVVRTCRARSIQARISQNTQVG